MDISRKRKLLALFLLYRRYKKRNQRERTCWVQPLLEHRDELGAFRILFEDLRNNEDKFFSYFRMSTKSFDELHTRLRGKLQRKNTGMRNCIQPIEMLAVTIRYLATGNTFTELHFDFKMGISTISKIVEEVCSSMWSILRDDCIPQLTTDKLKEISRGFQERANFPHCVGALDRKHIRLIKPEHTGSLHFNYKSYFSIVVLAVCDANYRFTYIDVGAYGSEADPTIFQQSTLWNSIQKNKIEFPEPELLPGTESQKVPYYFLGDDAFPLSTKLMRPFAGHNLPIPKRVFNYRLNRGRRYIECSFGILSNKWRIFHRALNVRTELAIKIVKACVVLHNFVIERDGYKFEDTTTVVGFEDLPRGVTRGMPLRGGGIPSNQLRNILAEYFMTDTGSLPWQLNII